MSDATSSKDPDLGPDGDTPPGVLAQLQTLIATLTALVTELRASLATKDQEIAELRRALLGPRSERQKQSSRASAPRAPLSDAEKAKRHKKAEATRAANRDKRKAELESVTIAHAAPDACPSCSATSGFTALPPETSQEIEYLEERLLRLVHQLGKKVCSCGQVFGAAAPARVTEGGLYGPKLHAYAVVSKCADALPLHRITKRFARAGVHIARSSLTDIFHRAAELLEPIYQALLARIPDSYYVNADETSQPVMDTEHCRRGFVWTFIADTVIAYVFSGTRAGETPLRILGGTSGYLQVDGHTGYNAVCVPEGRERIGCLAHARRYFHKARDHFPDECAVAFDYIRKLYQIEVAAAERGLLGTDAHKIMRRDHGQPLLDELHAWLEEQKPQHDPKGTLGRAIGYTLNQWPRLIRFVEDPKLRLDNNISEGALRIIALGRDNFRWVGHDVAGHNLCVLQTIVTTCVANDVNPLTYIADVLVRSQTHPASRIDELLPMNWARTVATAG